MTPNGPVFVYYFTHFAGGVDEWVERLGAADERLPGLARAAVRATSREAIADASTLSVGPMHPRRTGYVSSIEMRVPGLFDELSGDVQIDPIDIDRTQVTVRASYTPAWDADEVDHRLVEALVKRIVDSFEELSPASGDLPTSAE